MSSLGGGGRAVVYTGVPACFLIDCDAVRVRGRSVLPQLETPGWALPGSEPLASAAGDSYKFGLLAARLLAGDQDTRNPAMLAAIDPKVGGLAARSLSLDPAELPSLGEWRERLETVAARPTGGLRSVSGPPPPPATSSLTVSSKAARLDDQGASSTTTSSTGRFGWVLLTAMLLLLLLGGLLTLAR
ncbi:hypothetical protein [Kitasatospora sp. NPDC050543]|uniref:hypothetical protein n=1 Tax=Kitasatospora sp. NPDC050543 TaxID=3364054 RepID=UPI0037ABC170